MKEFLHTVFGETPAGTFAGYYFLGILGAVLIFLMDFWFRNADSTRTPYTFNPKFLWLDNVRRITITLIVIFAGIRFSPDIVHKDINPWVAFAIGLGSDALALFLKKFNLLGKQADSSVLTKTNSDPDNKK